MPNYQISDEGAENSEDLDDVTVAIIGNGPSAITLSFMLSGWTPYTQPCDLQEDDLVKLRLSGLNEITPLTEMDLMELSNGLEGRTCNPVALLFDRLSHPYADMGMELPSQLRWSHESNHSVKHLVFGPGRAGGLWQNVQGEMQTLSRANWMELPNMQFDEWLDRRCPRKSKSRRAYAKDLANYYEDYVEKQGLARNFLSGSYVTSVSKCNSSKCKSLIDTPDCWIVKGTRKHNGTLTQFQVRARHVVLATGTTSVPKRLKVTGEELPFIYHNVHLWDHYLELRKGNNDPVLVVGAGLSAADAILAARQRNLSIIHVFRETPCGSASSMLKKLPEDAYPEYVHMYKLMCGDILKPWYQGFALYDVESFTDDRRVALKSPEGDIQSYKISLAFIQIGSGPNLSYLPNDGKDLGVTANLPIDPRHNPIDADPFTYQLNKEPTMFALGPLVGDNFVRFLKGGALAITHRIRMNKKAV